MERVVAVDVLGPDERLQGVLLVGLCLGADFVGDMRVDELQMEPTPGETVGKVAHNRGYKKWVARLVSVLVVVLHAAPELVITGAIDVGGIGQLHLRLADGKRERQRGKPVAVCLALLGYIQVMVVIVEIVVLVAQPGL